MQENHFQGRYAGCNSASGVCCCDMKKLAALYDLSYYVIRGDGDIGPVLDEVMAGDGAVLCDVLCDYTFDEIPRAMSRLNPDGSMDSSALEDLYPFLPKEETEKWLRMALGENG